jgi:hypothetical protein
MPWYHLGLHVLPFSLKKLKELTVIGNALVPFRTACVTLFSQEAQRL